MPLRTLASLMPICVLAALPAQKELSPTTPPPVTRSDKDLVASRIGGDWQVDAELTRLLGGDSETSRRELHLQITDRLPDPVTIEIAGILQKRRIRTAGTLAGRRAEETCPFAVTTDEHGNTTLVCFQVLPGKPTEDFRENVLALFAAARSEDDRMVLQGRKDQPCTAYRRAGPAADAAKGGAIASGAADVANGIATARKLLVAKDYLGIVQTFIPPAEKDRIAKSGKTLDAVAADFGARSAADLLAMLDKIAGKEPTTSADGNTVTYQDPDGGRKLVWQRIDGRWYLK